MMNNKLNDQQRVCIANRLKASLEDSLVGVEEVAVLYNTTVQRIYQCTSPAKIAARRVTLKLPPPLSSINGRRKLWRLGDLLENIREQCIGINGRILSTTTVQGKSAPAKQPKRMGRQRGN